MGIIYNRLAELYILQSLRKLSSMEETELAECLAANTNYEWKRARLLNFSLMASMTNDMDWQHEICMQLEEIGDDPMM